MKLDDSIEKLRKKYFELNPLIFAKSVQRANNHGELFDILDSIPKGLPIIWSDEQRRWVKTDDLAQSRNFEFPEIEDD